MNKPEVTKSFVSGQDVGHTETASVDDNRGVYRGELRLIYRCAVVNLFDLAFERVQRVLVYKIDFVDDDLVGCNKLFYRLIEYLDTS